MEIGPDTKSDEFVRTLIRAFYTQLEQNMAQFFSSPIIGAIELTYLFLFASSRDRSDPSIYSSNISLCTGKKNLNICRNNEKA